MYLDIYLFNWTNPQDFTNKSIKPNLVEIGPYRFQEIPQKVNVTFHSANSTVSYRRQSRYFFVPDQSKGKLDDVITSLNIIALVSFVISRVNQFVTHSIATSETIKVRDKAIYKMPRFSRRQVVPSIGLGSKREEFLWGFRCTARKFM